MWSKKFWLEAIERAVKTFAQTLAALLIGDAAIDHVYATLAAKVGMAGMAAGVSLLTSIGGTTIGADNSPAWLPEKADPPAPRKRARKEAGEISAVLLVIVVVVAALVLGVGVSHWFLLLLLLLLLVAVL